MRSRGQTLIETALILLLIMVILLGITEFSRAWFTKNSLKNAVRQGAREAAVTPSLPITGTFDCISTMPCPNANRFINTVCCQPAVRPSDPDDIVRVTVDVKDAIADGGNADGLASRGEEVTVVATYLDNNNNFFIVGDGIWPWPRRLTVAPSASMRYE